VEVRAHDEPGLLWRIGRALGDCGLNVTAARVETLGAVAHDPAWIANSVANRGPAPVKGKSGSKPPRARFSKGDRVRARNLNPGGHTRLPRYVRGKAGVIARDWGVFDFPDTNAHHAGTKPQHCYSVSFAAHELWGNAANSRDRVFIDLWEDYLDPSASTPKPRMTTRVRKRK